MPNRGMTLIELMAALAVGAVLTGLSLAGFSSSITRGREGAAIDSVGQLASEARTRARKYRQPVRLKVTTLGTTRTMRWERLACADSWGSACPSVACAGSACGVGGCVCPEASEPLELPAGLVLPAALDGLCFSAGSGVPRAVSAGKFCDVAAAPMAPGALTFSAGPGVSQVLELEPLTGAGRMVDCRSGFKDPALCP